MTNIDVLALAAAGSAAAQQQPERKQRIMKRIRAAVEAITSGDAKTITDAAEKAGITRQHLSRELSKPHIAEYLRQKAARVVAIAAGRASARLVDLIDADSEHVSFDATKHTLAIAAIKRALDPSINFNIDVPHAGYVIDLSGRRPEPKVIDVTPTERSDGQPISSDADQ
jgi:sugar phosphate isomerase/epimerase